jgi:TP901 family phage tail tape measure protein
LFDAGAIVGRLELGLEGWKKSVEAVKQDQQSMAGFAQRHGEEIQNLGKKFAIAGAAITAALTAITIQAANAGDKFDEMAAKTGISTEVLSTLKLAADKSGTSIDSVAAGMKFLAAQMIETSTAGDKSATVLGAMGILATDTAGKLRPMNEVLFDVADRFAGMEAGAVKTKLAVALFGRAGMDMIPILDLGRKGLEENEAAARKLGIEWSGPSAKAASAMADALVDLKAANTGLGKTIGEALMPMVKDLVTSITGMIVKVQEWTRAHPELTAALSSFSLALGGVLSTIGLIGIAIPKLAAGFTILAAHPVVAAIIALGAALALAAAAADMMIKAGERQVKMDDDIRKGQGEIIESLSQAAAQCGITGEAWAKLTEKYHGNISAMAAAVLAGEEGTEMQSALNAEMTKARKAAEEHAAAVAKQAAEAKKLNPALQAVIDALDKSNKATKDGITVDNTFLGVSRDLSMVLFQFGVSAREAGLKVSNSFIPAARDLRLAMFNFGVSVKDAGLALTDTFLPKARDVYSQVGDMFPKVAAKSKEATNDISSRWDDMMRDISNRWASSLQGMIEGTKSFKDFLGDTWGAVKEAFFRLVADLLVKWIEGLITPMIASTAAVGTATAGMGAAAAVSFGTIATVAIAAASAIFLVYGAVRSLLTIFGILDAGAIDFNKVDWSKVDPNFGKSTPEPPPSGGGGAGACFVAGTPVTMADGTTRPIEQMQVGMAVRSRDLVTGKMIVTQVSETIAHKAEEAPWLIEINGDIRSTPEHPFYSDGEWVMAGDLKIGSELVGDNGLSVKLGAKTWYQGFVPVYNIHTDHESHNYFAGGVLVHNAVGKPTYDLGGYVPETGPAIVHAGEYVLTPQQVKQGGAGMTMNVNMTINAQTLDRSTISRAAEDIVEAIRFQMSRKGLSYAIA